MASMIITTLLVLGIASYRELGVDLYPRVELPNIVVTTTLPGAGPQEVETQVTKVIEEAVNTIEGIDELRSTSFEGLSQVVVVFKLSRDPASCAQDVRDRVGRVLGRLPQGVDPPVIEKFDPDAEPVLTVVVSGDMAMRDLTEVARRLVKENLESADGVGQVRMVGGREREVQILVDPGKLMAHRVTAEDVTAALRLQNLDVPGGVVETGTEDLQVRTSGRLDRVEDFEDVVLRRTSAGAVRLRDVADVVDGAEEARTLARLDGRNAVSLVCQKQAGENTVSVVDGLLRRLDEVRRIVPEGVELRAVRDHSRFITASFESIRSHLIEGSLLAALVVWIFLGTLRSTIIASVAIPTSIISTFTLMRYQGFTLDQLSMLGLTLAVGMVIDDAIVVLENVHRHVTEKGSPPLQAASEGTGEIALSVIATTVSLIVIFVPVAFMPGVVGRFLNSFGLTMAFAVCVSTLVSFVLTPPMCAYLLEARAGERPEGAGEDWLDRWVTAPYMVMLRWAMRWRWTVVGVSVLCILATGPLAQAVGNDFIPKEDQAEFTVDVRLPEGTPLARTSALLAEIEAKLRSYPEVELLLTTVGENVGSGPNEGQVYVGLVPIEARETHQLEVMRRAREFLLEAYPGVPMMVGEVPQLSGGGFRQNDLDLSIQGPDLELLERYGQEVRDLLADTPGVVDLDTSLSEGKPELRVEVDRDRAGALGLDVSQVARSLRTLVGGDQQQVTRYRDPEVNREYEVRVRLAPRFRDDPRDLETIPLRTAEGLVPLGALARVERTRGPTEIERYGRQRQVSLFANLQGIGLGEAQERIDAKLAAMELPPAYSYVYLGRSKVMKEQQEGFQLAFVLSTIFIFIVLAAEFESLLNPLIILFSLPLCVPFGIASLWMAGIPMNLYSTLGLFMLFGIVKKNAILQIDYTTVLVERGNPVGEAILEANRARLRPILMTTLTLVAGMLPMLVGQGPGAASRQSLAVVIVGGQSLCLLITLLLTPVAYSLFDDATRAIQSLRVRR
jgi:HAE1 family hydrophobic/amphiphilic exporter-1